MVLSRTKQRLKSQRLRAGGAGVTLGIPQTRETQERLREFGAELRRLCIGWHCSRKLEASEFGLLAYLHQRSGGCGLEGFEVAPKSIRNAARKIEHELSKTFISPELYYVQCPLFDTSVCKRQLTNFGIRLPTEAILEDHNPQDFDVQCCVQELGPIYTEHPVVIEAVAAGVELSRIIAVALYWDAFQFSNNDSSLSFYFQNMFTKKKYLGFTLRAVLSFHV